MARLPRCSGGLTSQQGAAPGDGLLSTVELLVYRLPVCLTSPGLARERPPPEGAGLAVVQSPLSLVQFPLAIVGGLLAPVGDLVAFDRDPVTFVTGHASCLAHSEGVG